MLIAVAAQGVMPAPASAQSAVAGQPLTVCIARVAPGQTIGQLFAGRIATNCDPYQQAMGAGDFWARATALPPRADPLAPVHVRIGSVWQDRVTFYGRYADGVIVALPTDGHGASRHIQLGAILERVFPARPVPLTEIAWRIDGSANLRGVLVGARVATAAESVHANLVMAAVYSAFAGLSLALVIYNLAMWRALRYRFQLAYCAMVTVLMVYALSSSAALAWLIPDIANNDRLRINYALLGVAAACALWFARSFFEERVYAGWLSSANQLVSFGTVAGGLAYGLLAPWHIALLDRLFAFVFLIAVAFIAPILWRARLQRSRFLWVFAFAWSAPVVLAGVRVASSLGAVRWSFWVDNSTILSMGAEALLSSLAIIHRVRLLSDERDDARVKELAARTLADTDPLTGLLNRRAFLAQAIGRAGEHRLLIADIDHFKAVNETIGHDGGDEVLRIFARTLVRASPEGALVARLGGEEFAILCGIGTIIDPEDMLTDLRRTRMPYDLMVTASIGSCIGPIASEADWKKLYGRADRALYEAKSQGRDRVRCAQPVALAA